MSNLALKWTSFSARKRRDYITAILFLTPSLLVFGVFVYYALAFNLYLSVTSWNFITPTKTFVGLKNYLDMFGDQRFWNVFRNTAVYSLGSVTISVTLGLFLAVVLNQKLPGRALFRTAYFTPYITTTAAIALLWVWIFDPNYGLINYFLSLISIEGPRWLTSTTWAMPALIIMNVWKVTGYVMVIYLAGLTGISRELLEAAEIDGANRWQSFWKITFPLLSPTTFFIVVTSLLNSFQVFDQVAVMTKGGPVDATKVFNYYIFEQAFINFKAGYAASVSTVFFLILLALTVFQLWFSKRWVHY